MFLSFLGDGKSYFIFRIEIGYVRYLKRPETVGSINKEACTVTSFFMLQGIQQCIQIFLGAGDSFVL